LENFRSESETIRGTAENFRLVPVNLRRAAEIIRYTEVDKRFSAIWQRFTVFGNRFTPVLLLCKGGGDYITEMLQRCAAVCRRFGEIAKCLTAVLLCITGQEVSDYYGNRT
jgi:hypothetical protein